MLSLWLSGVCVCMHNLVQYFEIVFSYGTAFDLMNRNLQLVKKIALRYGIFFCYPRDAKMCKYFVQSGVTYAPTKY